jgi:hypothetical protein
VLTIKGQTAEARRALEEALQAAQAIPNKRSRDMSIKRIQMALGQSTGGNKM